MRRRCHGVRPIKTQRGKKKYISAALIYFRTGGQGFFAGATKQFFFFFTKFCFALLQVRVRQERINSILSELLRGIAPTLRIYLTSLSLRLDVLPLLSRIIAPEFRAINFQLYTEQEKEILNKVVGTMVDYNLTYVQERTPEGTYIYHLGTIRGD